MDELANLHEDRTTVYYDLFIWSPRLIKFKHFPVNQLIKNAGLRIIFFNFLDVLNIIICMFSGTIGDI